MKKIAFLFQNLLEREYSPRALVFLFLLALGIGSSIKTLVNDSLTIGFDDYTISRSPQNTDLNLLEKQLIQKGSAITEKQRTPTGETCSAEGE